MSYRVAVDTGGTFTDVVVADSAHRLFVGKALTDPDRAFTSIRSGLEVAASAVGVDVEQLIAEISILVYSGTRSTNAIVEGKIAKTALLVTQGFPDILTLREGGKFGSYDLHQEFPEPYIPRDRTFEVPERVYADGTVLRGLGDEDLTSLISTVAEGNFEAIAVCLLNSQVNGVHERKIGDAIAAALPDVSYTLSHEINPIVREYRRASCAAIDASLKPLMQGHLSALEEDLRSAGFVGEVLAANSFGGAVHLRDLATRPVYSVRSGPSLAPTAAKKYTSEEIDRHDVIICDTGGTSFDVSLIRDGQIAFTRDTWLGQQFTGHITGLSSVDARSIGSGGGSIAWVDEGGLLRVGPHSAGAVPGPAAYGRGGTNATVTDAAVVLGYLDPEYFLGGRGTLEPSLAEKAVGGVASRLGQDTARAAMGIIAVANEHMVQAIQEMTIAEGIDPRESIIVAGGGAAGLNILAIAEEMGCGSVLVPRTAGALSACGGVFSDIVTEFSASALTSTSEYDGMVVATALDGIRDQMSEFESSLRAKGFDSFRREFWVEARYAFQAWELQVAIPDMDYSDEKSVDTLVSEFTQVHQRVYGMSLDDEDVDFIYWKGRSTAVLDPIQVAENQEKVGTKPRESSNVRQAFFESLGFVDVPVHKGHELSAGDHIAGPAVIQEETSTLVVYPAWTVDVTTEGSYLATNRTENDSNGGQK